jgi:hypothetical protein
MADELEAYGFKPRKPSEYRNQKFSPRKPSQYRMEDADSEEPTPAPEPISTPEPSPGFRPHRPSQYKEGGFKPKKPSDYKEIQKQPGRDYGFVTDPAMFDIPEFDRKDSDYTGGQSFIRHAQYPSSTGLWAPSLGYLEDEQIAEKTGEEPWYETKIRAGSFMEDLGKGIEKFKKSRTAERLESSARANQYVKPNEVFRELRNKYAPGDQGWLEYFLPDPETGYWGQIGGSFVNLGDMPNPFANKTLDAMDILSNPRGAAEAEALGMEPDRIPIVLPDLGDALDVVIPMAIEAVTVDVPVWKAVAATGNVKALAPYYAGKVLRTIPKATLGQSLFHNIAKTAAARATGKLARVTGGGASTIAGATVGTAGGLATIEDDDTVGEMLGKMAVGGVTGGALTKRAWNKFADAVGDDVAKETLTKVGVHGQQEVLGALFGALQIEKDDDWFETIMKPIAGAASMRILFETPKRAGEWYAKRVERGENETPRVYKNLKEAMAKMDRFKPEIGGDYWRLLKSMPIDHQVALMDRGMIMRDRFVAQRVRGYESKIKKMYADTTHSINPVTGKKIFTQHEKLKVLLGKHGWDALRSRNRQRFHKWMTKNFNKVSRGDYAFDKYKPLAQKNAEDIADRIITGKPEEKEKAYQEMMDVLGLDVRGLKSEEIHETVNRAFLKEYATPLQREANDMGRIITQQLNHKLTPYELDLIKNSSDAKLWNYAKQWTDLNAKHGDTLHRMTYNVNKNYAINQLGMSNKEAARYAKELVPEAIHSFFPKIIIPPQSTLSNMIQETAKKNPMHPVLKQYTKAGRPASEFDSPDSAYEYILKPDQRFVLKNGEEVAYRDLPGDMKSELIKLSIQQYAAKEARKSLSVAEKYALRKTAESRAMKEDNPFDKLVQLNDNLTDGFKASVLSGAISYLRNTTYDNLSKSLVEHGIMQTVKDIPSLYKSVAGKDFMAIAKGDWDHVMDDDLIRIAQRSGAIQTTRGEEALQNMTSLNENFITYLDPAVQTGELGKRLISKTEPLKKLSWFKPDELVQKISLERLNRYMQDKTKLYRSWIDGVNIYGLGSIANRMENIFRLSTFKGVYKELPNSSTYKTLEKAEGKQAAELWREEKAAAVTNDVYYDYSKTGYYHDQLAKRIFPFATFQRMNAFYYHHAFADPQKLFRIASQARQTQYIGDEPEGDLQKGLSPYMRQQFAVFQDRHEKGGYNVATNPSLGWKEYVNWHPALQNQPDVRQFIEEEMLDVADETWNNVAAPILGYAAGQMNPLLREVGTALAGGKDPVTGMDVWPSGSSNDQAYIGARAYYLQLMEDFANRFRDKWGTKDFVWRNKSGKLYTDSDLAVLIDRSSLYVGPLVAAKAFEAIPGLPKGLKVAVGIATAMSQQTWRSVSRDIGEIREGNEDAARVLSNIFGPAQIRTLGEPSVEYLGRIKPGVDQERELKNRTNKRIRKEFQEYQLEQREREKRLQDEKLKKRREGSKSFLEGLFEGLN